MTAFGKSRFTFFFVLGLALLFFISGSAVLAQSSATPSSQIESPTPSEDGLHVSITPYLWFAGVHGTVGVLGHNTAVSAGFGDIFNYLNIGAMGQMEVRYNRVIVPVDFMWMKLSDDKGVPLNDLGAESIKAKMTETILAPKIGYRVADGKKVKVDALIGIRYWHLSTDLTLEPPEVNGRYGRTADWVDAIAGGRIQIAVTPKAFVAIVGDAGGASARSDYQIGGFLGYKVSRKCVLLAGYRYLSVDYRPNSHDQFVYDVDMPGLMIGATINLK
jgi:hypothetical protein